MCMIALLCCCLVFSCQRTTVTFSGFINAPYERDFRNPAIGGMATANIHKMIDFMKFNRMLYYTIKPLCQQLYFVT